MENMFENGGLKIEKDRVLVYSQLNCPFNCKYCFIDELNSEHKDKSTYLTEKQFDLIENLPKNINLIMLGCDTEFFQPSFNGLKILNRISDLGRDISVVTRYNLSDDLINSLAGINDKLIASNNLLAISVSLPCLDSAKKWEPKTTDPSKRIEMLKKIYQKDIKTMVALRPLLPDVPNHEIMEIIEKTKEYCYGYYSGPLYLKKLDNKLLDFDKTLKIEEVQPDWMPEGNIFYKIEKEGQMDFLKDTLIKQNKPYFEGAVDGVKYLKNL